MEDPHFTAGGFTIGGVPRPLRRSPQFAAANGKDGLPQSSMTPARTRSVQLFSRSNATNGRVAHPKFFEI
jgi:hypothetical protein